MTQTSLPQPHEQRKIERLLARLAKMNPPSPKPELVKTNVARSSG